MCDECWFTIAILQRIELECLHSMVLMNKIITNVHRPASAAQTAPLRCMRDNIAHAFLRLCCVFMNVQHAYLHCDSCVYDSWLQGDAW